MCLVRPVWGTRTRGLRIASEAERGSTGSRRIVWAKAASKGVTDDTLKNAGWSCLYIGDGFTVCAQPGQSLPPIPFVPVGHRLTCSRHSSTASSIIT